MTQTKRFTVNRPAIIDEIIDDEVVVVDLQRGIYFSIRGSGTAIWNLLVDSATVDEAILHVGAEGQAASAVAEFVAALEQESLVRGVADQDSTSGSRPPLDVPFEPPLFERFTDMEDLLLLDPVHDVDEQGWPHLGAAT
jgi:hypothetical protein